MAARTLEQLHATRAKVLARARRYARQAKLNSRRAKASRTRAAQLGRLIAARKAKIGGDAAVTWALKQASDGVVEHPPMSNWGPKIETWIRAAGYTFPVSWCQCFADAAAVHGGAPQIVTGYTPWVMQLNPTVPGIKGYRRVTAEEARPGDFVYYKWPGTSHDPCDHVGVLVQMKAATVLCVEGNTSPGNGGDQSNGGGVFVRERSKSLVVGYMRPPWPKS
jgi:hypothetical protein